MKKIRLSFTLLSLWDRGDVDGAVDTYFHLDHFVTPAMINGRKVHEQIEQEINKIHSNLKVMRIKISNAPSSDR